MSRGVVRSRGPVVKARGGGQAVSEAVRDRKPPTTLQLRQDYDHLPGTLYNMTRVITSEISAFIAIKLIFLGFPTFL